MENSRHSMIPRVFDLCEFLLVGRGKTWSARYAVLSLIVICLFFSQGLTSAQYQANLAKYGPNCLTPPPQIPAWLKFLLQFTNFFALLLMVGGLLCFIGFAIDPAKDPTNVSHGTIIMCS